MLISVIDIIFAGILLLAAIHGAMKGLIHEFFSKAAFILGILLAAVFYENAASLFQSKIESPVIANILGFLAVFIAVFIIISIIQKILSNIFSGETMKGLDRALGFFFGIFEGLVVVCIVLLVIYVQPFFDASTLVSDSFFHNMLKGLLNAPKEHIDTIKVTALYLPLYRG